MTTPVSWQATNHRLWNAIRTRTLPPELLVVGPAGTGKTWGILDVLHVLCRDNANLRVLVARATRAALTESALVTYEQQILPLDGMESVAAGVLRRVRQSYAYPSGSEVVLGGLDDSNRILSTEWDFVYINEAIEANEDVWETILSRMSRPGRRSRFGHLIGDTNPGDPGHWLRKRVDEKKLLVEWETPHQANPALFDGKGWTPAGVRYRGGLNRSLTKTRRKRLFEGLWAAGEGLWFDGFDSSRHVTEAAEFDPRYPVHLAVDTGVHTGAVWFQVRDHQGGPRATVFGDFYSFGVNAFDNAREILEQSGRLCRGRHDVGRMDPAGNADSGFGATTIGSEYRRAGLHLSPWIKFPGCVSAGLGLVEALVASDPPALTVHPRCRDLVNAFANYRRLKRSGQFVDEPEDPQHPYEELIDSLRSGLLDRFPEGRKPEPLFVRRHARSVL